MDVHTDASGNIVVDRRTVEGFASRVDSIFGGLLGPPIRSEAGPSSPVVAPPWALSSDIVYRAGKDDEYSSDEEEEAAEHERMRQEQLPGTDLNSDGEEAEDLVKPSVSFCKALDHEEEYDQTDAVASTSLSRFSCAIDPMPDRKMEVLDDNIYDLRAREHHDVIVRHAEAKAEAAAGTAAEAAAKTAAEPAGEAAGLEPSGPTAMEVEEEGPPFPLAQTLTPAATASTANPAPAPALSLATAVTADRSASSMAPPTHAGMRDNAPSPPASQGGGIVGGVREQVGEEPALRGSGEGGSGEREPGLDAAVERVERAAQQAEEGEKPAKRVRFKEGNQVWVPPHRREGAIKPALRQPTQGGQAMAVGRVGVGGGRRGQSYVPDHVRHPEKYTMYTLDEPLFVGGGNGHGESDSQADMLKAARAAQSAAQTAAQPQASSMEEDSPRELPAFGAGIEFRRKDRPEKTGEVSDAALGAAAKVAPGPRLGLLNLDEDELPDSEDVEPMEEEGVSGAADGVEGPPVFAVRARKQRKLRSKTSAADDSAD